MDDIDCAAERVDAFNEGALRAVLQRHPATGPMSSGVCLACGAAIEADRVAANPHARHCRDCADEIEAENRRKRRCGPR